MTRRGLFITGTGTGVGKTEISIRLCELLKAAGARVLALKPIETGADPEPQDALRLARACGDETLAHHAGFYRARRAVAPWAATLAGEAPCDLPPIVHAVRNLIARAHEGDPTSIALVEGAGGPLVPLTHKESMRDLCTMLSLPVVVVARDTLGVLSHTITACESLQRSGVDLVAVVLNRFGEEDESQSFNERILREWLNVPVYRNDQLTDLVSRLLDGIAKGQARS